MIAPVWQVLSENWANARTRDGSDITITFTGNFFSLNTEERELLSQFAVLIRDHNNNNNKRHAPEPTDPTEVLPHRTELVMPKDIYDQMRSIAKRRGQTVSDAIREAVRDWIEAKA